jgi:hypothetical protein
MSNPIRRHLENTAGKCLTSGFELLYSISQQSPRSDQEHTVLRELLAHCAL